MNDKHLPTIQELYDALHTGSPGDVQFYLKHCASSSNILELGCGSGRMMEELLKKERPITGIELSPQMLEAAHRRLSRFNPPPFKLVLEDIRQFSLPETFSHIIIPYNTLYCLLEDRDIIDCFETAYAHLKPDGRLIFDVYAVEEDTEYFEGEEPDLVASFEYNEFHIDIHEERSWSDTYQRLDAFYTHTISNNDDTEIIRYTIPQRYLFKHQLEQLLSSAGFQIEHLYGDFDETPWNPESYHMIVIAKPLP